MKHLSSVVLGGLMTFAAVGGASAAPETYGPPAPSKAFEFVNGKWQRRADSCGTHQVRKAPEGAELVPGGMGPIRVYLNRNGGTYNGSGTTNSATNATSLFSSGSLVVAPMSSSFNWTTLRACILAHYAAYDVNFTDTEPSSGNYIEAVIGGDGTELGIDGLLGIASADNFCGITQRGIAFSFSEAHLGIPQQQNELCATVAHEIGHLLALEHEVLGTDTMSYVFFDDAGSKSFHDQNSTCGTTPSTPGECSCSAASTTNSGGRLEEFAGLASGPTNEPPVMAITAPADGATVAPGFTVIATGNEPLAKVELRVDGQLVDTDTTAPYQLLAPDTLDAGNHSVQVRGYDPQNATGNASITVMVEGAEPPPQCENDDDCDDGDECVDDECVPEGTTPGELGDECEHDEDCASDLCLVSGSDQYCVETCDPDDSDCPSGFECLPFDGSGACWPGNGGDGDGEGGGGCATTGGSGGAPILLGVGLAALLGRRRRKASHTRSVTRPR